MLVYNSDSFHVNLLLRFLCAKWQAHIGAWTYCSAFVMKNVTVKLHSPVFVCLFAGSLLTSSDAWTSYIPNATTRAAAAAASTFKP